MDIRKISDVLKQGEDEIWYAQETQSISYPADSNDACYAVEDKSFWFRHRNECIVSVVKAFLADKQATVFDIGGGNGFVSAGLSAAGIDTVLVEPGKNGAANAKKRGIKNVICATLETAHFKPQSLPSVGLFDVVEHVENDVAFLRSLSLLMKKGGMLYITVPAFSSLWSQEDVMAGHFRRYTLNSISDVLKATGFEIIYSSYIFGFLTLPIFLLRTLPYKMGFSRKNSNILSQASEDHIIKPSLLSFIIKKILQREIGAIKAKKIIRFGGSCLIVGRCL